jgi:chitinase
LNLGVHFYGVVWSGASGPNQSIAGVTTTTQSYAQILDQYETATYYWQNDAEAPYLSVLANGGQSGRFISYEDPTLVGKKVAYVRAQGLGGVSIWELAGGHRASQAAGQQDPLVDALRQAVEAK